MFKYLLMIFLVFCIVCIILNKLYKIHYFKLLLFIVLSIIYGILSTKIMSWIESGNLTGTSFYGAIFLIPIFVLIFSMIFKVESWKLFNLSAFLGMITSAVMKYRCFLYGCCGGKKVPIVTERGYLTFPSQIAEMIFAIIVFIILTILFFRKKERKDLYPIMMIIYGVGRFILNSYRLVKPVFGFMALGHLWSILSVFIGVVWLLLMRVNCKNI